MTQNYVLKPLSGVFYVKAERNLPFIKEGEYYFIVKVEDTLHTEYMLVTDFGFKALLLPMNKSMSMIFSYEIDESVDNSFYEVFNITATSLSPFIDVTFKITGYEIN